MVDGAFNLKIGRFSIDLDRLSFLPGAIHFVLNYELSLTKRDLYLLAYVAVPLNEEMAVIACGGPKCLLASVCDYQRLTPRVVKSI